ncbi:MAG: hypothetical protein WCR27_10520, partial [Eubacteriales bacterium]
TLRFIFTSFEPIVFIPIAIFQHKSKVVLIGRYIGCVLIVQDVTNFVYFIFSLCEVISSLFY